MTETATKDRVEKVRDLVKSYEGSMSKLLPKTLSVERMTQIAVINIGRIPKLAECHPATLIGSILESARLGLEPGAGPGHTWLIPFLNRRKERMEVQIIIDYRAIVKRLKTHAGAHVVFAEAVRENDSFEYGVGPKGLHLNFRPADGDRGAILRYFAAAWDKEGCLLGYNVMTAEEVEAIRGRAKSSSGPWNTDHLWMAKKTCVRPLCKLIPHTDDTLSRMGELTDQETFDVPQDLGILVDPDETKTQEGDPPKDIAEPKSKSSEAAKEEDLINPKQLKMIFAKWKNTNITEDELKAFIKDKIGVDSRSKIPKNRVQEVVKFLEPDAK